MRALEHDLGDLTATIDPDTAASATRWLISRGGTDLLPMLGLVDSPTPCGVHAAGHHCTRLAGHEGKHRWER